MRIIPLLALTAMLTAASPALGHDGHVHETHDVAAESAPVIKNFAISGTPADGFTVTVEVENFTFVEDGTQVPPGQHAGHVHLSINGADLGMYYEPVFTIEELPYGPHDLTVVLSDTEHLDYAINGRPIAATTTFTVE